MKMSGNSAGPQPGGRPTERKVQLGFITGLVVLIAVATTSYVNLRRFIAYGDEVKRAERFVNDLHSVQFGITEAETAQRGYIITGQTFYLDAYDAEEAMLPGRVANLRNHGMSPAALEPHLSEVERLVRARLERARETIEIRRREGFAPAQERLMAGIGKSMIEGIKAHIQNMEAEAQTRLVASEERARKGAERTELVVLAGGAVALIVVAMALWVVRRDFSGARRADEELRATQAELERRVVERTAQLAEVNSALRDREARIQTIVENMTEGLIVVDVRGKILQMNPAARAMLGLAGNEVEDTEVARIGERLELRKLDGSPLPEDDWPMARIRRGERLHEMEVRIRQPEGLERIFSYSGTLVRRDDGEALGFVAITDVTARREAEEALRLSEAKFARAFANNPAAIILTQLEDGVVLEVNDTWVALAGYSREEIVGKSARAMWPSVAEARWFVETLRRDGVVRGVEQDLISKSGQRFAVQFASQVLMLAGKAVVISTLVDVSARRRAEQAREQERRRVVLLADVSRRLVTTDAPRAVLRNILTAIAQELSIEVVLNYLLTSNGRMRLEHATGLNDEQTVALGELSVGESLCGLVAERRTPLIIADLPASDLSNAAGLIDLGVKAYAGFPLFAGKQLIGTIAFGSRNHSEIPAAELQMLETATDQISAAMERARLLGELRRSEQRHRMLYNTMVQGVVYHDAAGVVAAMNPAARQMLALAEEAVGLPLATIAARMVSEDGSALAEAEHPAAIVLREGREVRGRLLGWRDARAGLRWLNVNAVAQHGEGSSRMTGVFVIFEDITDQRRAEEALRNHEALLREMGRLAQVGGWTLEVSTDQIYWTDEMERIHDLPPGTRLSRERGLRHFPAEALPAIESAVDRAITAGVPYDLELPFVSATGRRKWVRAIAHPVIERGQVVRLRGSLQDITERKRAEQRLATQAAVSRVLAEAATLAEAAPQVLEAICFAENWQFGAFWELDRSIGRMRAVATWQPAGANYEELNRATRALNLGEGEGLPGLVWKTRSVRFMPEVANETSFVRREVAGRTGLRSALGFPIIMGQEVVGAVDFLAAEVHEGGPRLEEMFEMIGRQIGLFLQRRRAEDEVRRVNAELEERVQRRTAELEAANKELEAFSYSVSHDLRAPLRAVDGFSRIVIEDYSEQLPAEARHYLENVASGAQRMGTLIDDLLTFSRLSRLPLHRAEIDTQALVDGVLYDLLPMREGRQVVIRCEPLPPSRGDQALLRQVWINLLSNALKYTRLRATAEIDISGRVEGDETIFTVRDNGAGFDMRYVDKLFGVFQRLHRSEDYEGTGVGLAIVQRIVHRHGGRVWADAEVERGATFGFTLTSKVS